MTDRESLRQGLVEVLEADTGELYPDCTEEKKLREELGLDSLDVISLVAQIEHRHNIRLSHEELSGVATIGDVLTVLQSKFQFPLQTEPSAA